MDNLEQKGQSLVELAIAIPLLLIMLIGVFEVGYAIRQHMVLDVATREAARYAAKNHVLDFEGSSYEAIGYDQVISHTLVTIGEQIPVDFESQGHIVISLFDMPMIFPCDPETRVMTEGDMWVNCDCKLDIFNPYTSTIPMTPDTRPFYSYGRPDGTETKTDYGQITDEMFRDILQSNCILGKTVKDITINDNKFVMVEIWFDHYQLIGFPGLANRLTDPIPMYSRMVMRSVTDRE